MTEWDSRSWCWQSGVLVRQHYKVTMSVHCHCHLPLSPTGLVPQLWSTASYLVGTLVSSSGAANVTVLRPVPFPKCTSSNYTMTQTIHAYIITHFKSIFMDACTCFYLDALFSDLQIRLFPKTDEWALLNVKQKLWWSRIQISSQFVFCIAQIKYSIEVCKSQHITNAAWAAFTPPCCIRIQWLTEHSVVSVNYLTTFIQDLQRRGLDNNGYGTQGVCYMA